MLLSDPISCNCSNASAESSQLVTVCLRFVGKNPDVDTSFLPDRDREEEDSRMR
jgi:hypothetical protein